jgi:hypothetical protein
MFEWQPELLLRTVAFFFFIFAWLSIFSLLLLAAVWFVDVNVKSKQFEWRPAMAISTWKRDSGQTANRQTLWCVDLLTRISFRRLYITNNLLLLLLLFLFLQPFFCWCFFRWMGAMAVACHWGGQFWLLDRHVRNSTDTFLAAPCFYFVISKNCQKWKEIGASSSYFLFFLFVGPIAMSIDVSISSRITTS